MCHFGRKPLYFSSWLPASVSVVPSCPTVSFSEPPPLSSPPTHKPVHFKLIINGVKGSVGVYVFVPACEQPTPGKGPPEWTVLLRIGNQGVYTPYRSIGPKPFDIESSVWHYSLTREDCHFSTSHSTAAADIAAFVVVSIKPGDIVLFPQINWLCRVCVRVCVSCLPVFSVGRGLGPEGREREMINVRNKQENKIVETFSVQFTSIQITLFSPLGA